MQTLLQDLRYATRLLIKSPSFTLVALATLAVGIGANAAIFSVVNALLLKPLPYPEPQRLVMPWQDLRERGGPDKEWLAPAHFFDWTNRSRSFAATTVFRGGSPSLTGSGEPEQLRGWQVSADFFRVLGVSPMLGRDFRAEDDQPGAPGTAIITHGLWQRRFGGNPALVGQTISLNREPWTVIGVLPPSFRSPFASPEIFRPLRFTVAARASRGNITLQMIARLKPEMPLEQAQAEMTAVAAALAREYPDYDKGSTIRIATLRDEVAGDVRTPLLALLGAVVLVLLIACANIASLQLARASIRGREMAVRAALGAGRARLARQLLTESVLLGILGSVGGLLLSSWMLTGLLALAPDGTPRLDEVRIDSAVLAFGILLALVTSVSFGLVPAVQSARRDVMGRLKESGRSGGGGHGVGARSLFVVAELALALMLLVGAALLMRSLANIRGVDPGFTPDRLLTGVVTLPAAGYEQRPEMRAFYSALLERLESTPGVTAAGLVSVLPFSGEDSDVSFTIEGRPAPKGPDDQPVTWYRVVSPDYFRAMGMQMEAGRFIEARDRDEADGAVAINRTLANRFWPAEDPIGRRIRVGSRSYTIVGVVRDVRDRNLREDPRGETFFSYQQSGERRMTLVLKSQGDPTGLLPAVRRHLASLDPSLPLSNVTTVDALLAATLALPRMIALLMSVFAAASLLLAAIGIYGLMAYAVTLRTQEFGIRMALGAAASDVLRLVLGQAGRLALAGIVIGAVAAFGAARLISTLLFGITASDVPTFAGTALLLGAIALLASYLPARRAIRVDPVRALRAE